MVPGLGVMARFDVGSLLLGVVVHLCMGCVVRVWVRVMVKVR